MHDTINPKNPKKEREKNFKFPQEWQKDKSIQSLSPSIHLKGWTRHFEHEYIMKLPKKLIES